MKVNADVLSAFLWKANEPMDEAEEFGRKVKGKKISEKCEISVAVVING